MGNSFLPPAQPSPRTHARTTAPIGETTMTTLPDQEQRELTITYALLFGGRVEQENTRTWYCSGWVGDSAYVACTRFLEWEKGFYLHSNGTLMKVWGE
jgi:hypothetical protein